VRVVLAQIAGDDDGEVESEQGALGVVLVPSPTLPLRNGCWVVSRAGREGGSEDGRRWRRHQICRWVVAIFFSPVICVVGWK
jgi:hypothetical protein